MTEYKIDIVRPAADMTKQYKRMMLAIFGSIGFTTTKLGLIISII